MEMSMSNISNSAIPRESVLGAALRSVGSALKSWCTAYINWRLEQLAIRRLRSMSDRELKDIGIPRASIESAVRSGADSHPLFARYY
jgi:uncharacterized protein YjiS (DUF1127 family)